MLVLGALHGFSHVRGWFGDAMLDGWVPSSALERTTSASSATFDTEREQFFRRDGILRCAVEVPLPVRFNGRLLPLGTLRKNAAWKELHRSGEQVDLALPELPWLTLEPGAAFVITPESAAACAP